MIWRAIGAAVDYFKLDIGGIHPTAYHAEGPAALSGLLRRAVSAVERAKLLLGLGVMSIVERGDALSAISFGQALAVLGDVRLSADRVSETGSVEPGTRIHAELDGLQPQLRLR